MLAALVEPPSTSSEGGFSQISCRFAHRRIGGGRLQRREQRAHREQKTLQSRRGGGSGGCDKTRVSEARDPTAQDADIVSRLPVLEPVADRRQRFRGEYVPIARRAECGRKPSQLL